MFFNKKLFLGVISFLIMNEVRCNGTVDQRQQWDHFINVNQNQLQLRPRIRQQQNLVDIELQEEPNDCLASLLLPITIGGVLYSCYTCPCSSLAVTGCAIVMIAADKGCAKPKSMHIA